MKYAVLHPHKVLSLRKFHIADWSVEPDINAVSRGERSFHLEPKVMQVLLQLAMHPNQVLSKEQLIAKVWADAFVTDDVLTRSISEIRRVLDDDARSPRYIQTIPKSGYRLIVPVSFEPEPVLSNEPQSSPASGNPVPGASSTAMQPRTNWALPIGLLVLLMLAVTVFVRTRRPVQQPQPSYKAVPLTSNLGTESQPNFSPDGKQIAYVWDGGNGGFRHVYVKLLGTESELRLTSGEANDYSPVWSPDGTSIAFLRQGENELGIYIVPAIGGTPRKVYTPSGKIDVAAEWERGALSWSPDGHRIIFPDGKSATRRSAIFSLDLQSMSSQQITAPSNLLDGDYCPVFSPDGNHIAFVRGSEGFVRDIYVMPASGGEPSRLTSDNRYVSSLAWTNDSRSIVFSSNRSGRFGLWQVSVEGGQPERLPVGGDDAFAPAIAHSGALAYVQRFAKWSLIRASIAAPGETSTLLTSIEQESAPRYSPDGSRIAFQSWRSGTPEIWTIGSNGAGIVKVTSFGGPLTGSPAWSPDGRKIAFDSRRKGHSHIYVVSDSQGQPDQVTDGDFNDILPSWAHDGRSIYFSSNRSGSFEIWKLRLSNGTPQQITSHGGFLAEDSEDGKWLYYTKSDAPGVFRMSLEKGAEEILLAQPAVGYWGFWDKSGDEIFYLDSTGPSLNVFDIRTHRSRQIAKLKRMPPPFSGVTVAPDRKSLLYTDLSDSGSHITLVENFR